MSESKEINDSQREKVIEDERNRISSISLTLSSSLQEELVNHILADVENDEGSRKEFIEKRKEVIDAYEGKKSPKSDPFPNCANVRTMITCMVVELLHAKLFPAIWNEELAYWVPQEKSDIQTSEGVSKFMKWALRSMKFGSFVDDWTKNLVLEGTVVSKVRWDVEFRWVQRKIPKKNLAAKRLKNVVMNLFGQKKVTKIEEEDFDITYDYKKFENCVVEILPLEDVGFPVYSIPGSDENKLRHIWHRTRPFMDDLRRKESQGFFTNISKVGSDIESFIVIQGTDKSKMEAEGSKVVDIQKANYPLEQIEWYGEWNIPGKGPIEIICWVERKTRTFLGAMPLVNVSRINRRPFVINQSIRRPGRMYGKSIAEPVMELENEINSIHNQRLDAGTMSIIPPGLYRAASGTTPEEFQLRPGLWIPVDDINDMKYLVMPNNVLVSFQEERMLMELVEKISSAGAYQSGQESSITRTRSTARGTMALIAQGEQRFNVMAKRAQFGLGKILVQILQNYQQNIPPGLEQRVLGDTGDPIFPEGLSPEDIAGNYDIHMTLDSTGGSKAMEQQISAQVYQGMIQNPIVQSNPAYLWEITADTLKAAGKVDIERYIGPKPQVPTDIAKDVNEENMLLLQNKSVKVNQNDNVLQHIIGHMYFKESPEGLSMTPESRQKLDAHIEETKVQLVQFISQLASQVPGAEGGVGVEEGSIEGALGLGGMEGEPAPQAQPGAQPPAAVGPQQASPGGIQGGSPLGGVGGLY